MSSRCDGLLSATSGVPGAFNTSSCTPALAVYVSACPRNSTQQSLLPVQSCKLLEPVQLSIFLSPVHSCSTSEPVVLTVSLRA